MLDIIYVLLKNKKSFIIVNSPLHSQRQYLLDKKEFMVEEVNINEFNKQRDKNRYIKLVSTLPLGAIGHEKKSGYLRITNKKIEHIEKKR